jgi:hypothetical protein
MGEIMFEMLRDRLQIAWNWILQRQPKLDHARDYWDTLVKQWNEHLFETTSPVGVAFIVWWITGSPPVTFVLCVLVWVFLLAGYYAWREEHERLIPKMRFANPAFCFHDQSTDEAEERRYLQVLLESLSDAPVNGCHAYLQRIMQWGGSGWVATQYDHAMGLTWSFQKQFAEIETRTLYKKVDQRINVAFVTSSFKFGIETTPQNMAIKSLDMGIFRFDIHVVAKDCAPLDLSLRVELGITAGQEFTWKDTLIVERL